MTLALLTPVIVGQLIGLPVILATSGKLTELIKIVVGAEPGIVDTEEEAAVAVAGAAPSTEAELAAGGVSMARGTPAAEQVAEAKFRAAVEERVRDREAGWVD